MKDIIGVRFKKLGKIYFFDPGNNKVEKGQFVIVETTMGQEYSEVIIANRKMDEKSIVKPLKKIVRVATKIDEKHNEENIKVEKEAFKIANQKIKEHNLKMTLVEVDYKFDNSKMLFYFTADGRIDFRELVKDLASIYKTRIELRQIGVRDEVKKIGGNGICGRELCCCSFLDNFETVSIKMAKEQNLSLTPSKISGNCGRLMCCLKYEQEVYEEKLSRLPKIGALVKTEEGKGIVDNIEILKEKVNVKFKDKEGYYYKRYDVKDIKIIKDAETVSINEEEQKNLEELEKLEELQEQDIKEIKK